jgi:hypothetical protein
VTTPASTRISQLSPSLRLTAVVAVVVAVIAAY